jgi:hypothetical protein
MVTDGREDLVNPYGSGARRRFTLGGTPRRRVGLLVVLVVSVAVVGGTVGTSCAPPRATQQDITEAPADGSAGFGPAVTGR